jgi:hypothetical protein
MKLLGHVGATVLAVVLLACASGAPSVRAVAPAADATLCRVENFQAFLERFTDDVEFQQQHTAAQLQTVQVDNSGREPTPVEKLVARADLKFPVIPPSAKRKQDGLEMTVEPAKRGMKVTLKKPDTDYLIEYTFEHAECGQLVRRENASL